ncbi:hypothetical protein LguiA_015063 [Lonicera macranthoides]
MSPEYAVAGIFSKKSDVFRFMVMLLEIASSKKNTSFNYHEHSLILSSKRPFEEKQRAENQSGHYVLGMKWAVTLSFKISIILLQAWKLWNENRGLDLIDQQAIGDSYSKSQVMKSVQVGLLCVQDHAADRPTVPALVKMPSSETDLPQPKQPTFTFRCLLNSGLRSKYNNFPIKEAIVSTIEGR